PEDSRKAINAAEHQSASGFNDANRIDNGKIRKVHETGRRTGCWRHERSVSVKETGGVVANLAAKALHFQVIDRRQHPCSGPVGGALLVDHHIDLAGLPQWLEGAGGFDIYCVPGDILIWIIGELPLFQDNA